MEDKRLEETIDTAAKIQEALKPLGYKIMAFSDTEDQEYTIRVKYIGVYSAPLSMDGISESFTS
ncbi:hypothetical protein FACS1894151_10240 [Spirochaetia bacterium]|nr:hypothetical protein FACS1894151_10240 [Spirochaetia bacterium]